MGGDENSWGQGQAWLPLWKSPPHPPLHRGAEADSPLPAQMYACCPFFTPRVRKAEVGRGHPEVKVDPGKDQLGLLLVTPHIGQLTSRKVTCTELTPSHPRAHLGQVSHCWGKEAPVSTGLAEKSCCPVRIPSQQVSFFFLSLSQQAELCEGHSPASLPDTLALRSRSAGVGSHPLEAPRGGSGRRRLAGRSRMFSNFTVLLNRNLGSSPRPDDGTRPPPQEFAPGSDVL